MKTRKSIISRNGVAAMMAVVIVGASECHSQTLALLETKATVEGAIQLRWQSEVGAVYQIEYASQLVNGNTSWEVLKTQYPSHGASTIWLDTGDYSQTPSVLHPNKESK